MDESALAIEQIRERVINIVAKISMIDATEIHPDSSFVEMGLDSLSRIEILVELEREFGFDSEAEDEQADEELLARIQTADDAARFVEAALANKQ